MTDNRILGIIGRVVASLMALALLIKNAFRSYAHISEVFVHTHRYFIWWECFMVVMYWGLFLLVCWKFFPPMKKDD